MLHRPDALLRGKMPQAQNNSVIPAYFSRRFAMRQHYPASHHYPHGVAAVQVTRVTAIARMAQMLSAGIPIATSLFQGGSMQAG
jgi:hypothetical protein